MHDQPHDPAAPSSAAAHKQPKIGRFLAVAGLVLITLAVSGIVERNHSDAALATWTNARAIPTVDLVSPQSATDGQHLRLPAEIQAFDTARIHARVNGYVKAWYVDIGAHVKAGDVLARIDTPDLDQQYEQAKGELAKAQADYNLSAVTAARWKALRGSEAVSQQASDEKTSDALARKAEVAAAQADVDRLKALEGFKDITAPFDGIVTARHIDIGALVATTSSNEPGLFDISATDEVRVYVRVPQVYAAAMHTGLPVSLKLPQYPGRTFAGVLQTNADAISEQSRALLVEAIVKNSDGLLSPGSYAQAAFNLPLDPQKLTVPASAMIFRGGDPKVAIVEDNKVLLKPVSVLVDTGTRIELSSGLQIADKIVVNPSDSIADGDIVHVAEIDHKPVDDKIASARLNGITREARE